MSGIDVAKYILTQVQDCTHLKLEKLAYLCYAEYLCDTGKRLFEDEIYAFQYGPVVSGIYDVYKKRRDPLDKDFSVSTDVDGMPAKSRILFACDGTKKLSVIDKLLTEYGGYIAAQLVSITHRDGSPWSHADSSMPYQIISDELIKQYHCNEVL